MTAFSDRLSLVMPLDNDPLGDIALVFQQLCDQLDERLPNIFGGEVDINPSAADTNTMKNVAVPAGVFKTPAAGFYSEVKVFTTVEAALSVGTGYITSQGLATSLTNLQISCRRSSTSLTTVSFLAIQFANIADRYNDT